MPVGEPFTGPQRYDIDNAVRAAGEMSGLKFSVFVGGADRELRPFAEKLHAALPDADRSVLLVVDPAAQWLEIVTGVEARRTLSDEDCRFAALAMQSAFANGDLAGGIVQGVVRLGERAQHPPTLHTDEH